MLRTEGFRVIHPLDDAHETKCSGLGLGHMQMTTSVKLSLLALRCYLMLVMGMTVYHVLVMAGVL